MRRSYNGALCTVKYEGPLPVWAEDALGVEWDDPARGKHSGELEGRSYFSCSVPGSGSFLKKSKLRDAEHTLSEAFHLKYEKKFSWQEISLSRAKTIETYQDAKPLDLHSISLSRQCITRLDDLDLPKVETLDLSYNLLSDLGHVFEACSRYKYNLRSLDLGGNRFAKISNLPTLHGLEELNLRATMLTASEIELIAAALPNLRRLGLSYNRLVEAPHVTVDWLDLSYNQLTKIPTLCPNLVLISNRVNITEPVRLSSLQLMDQANVLEWSALDLLEVPDLWLSETLGKRSELIGRLPHLRKLNGVAISSTERRDCEAYVVAQIRQGRLEDVPPETHAKLEEQHGPFSAGDSTRSIAARLCRVDVQEQASGRVHTLELVGDAPAQRLLDLCRRRLGSRRLYVDGVLLEGSALADSVAQLGQVTAE